MGPASVSMMIAGFILQNGLETNGHCNAEPGYVLPQ